jgi:hypothetical protein
VFGLPVRPAPAELPPDDAPATVAGDGPPVASVQDRLPLIVLGEPPAEDEFRAEPPTPKPSSE